MWTERIYSYLPIALQNVAVSLKGREFHQARYLNRAFHEASRCLAGNERLSLAALQELQFSMLREFLSGCFARSGYYQACWKACGLYPEDIRNPEDIRRIPIVPKQDLRARTEQFLTDVVNGRATAVHTSGTTGSPLTVYFSSEDLGRRYAFLERCRRWAGVRIGQRRASFTGRSIIPQRQQKQPYWRYNRSGKQMLFSSYHLCPENLPSYAKALEEFQPEIIDGYPSAIHVVAEHMLRHTGVYRVRPRAILVSAETVLVHQRRAIEAAFGAKLYNQYSSSEGGPFISECAEGMLHVHLDSGVVEILDAEGNPARPGEVGQMVVTSFTTHLTPLVRYAIGDTAVACDDPRPCPCGLPLPTVAAIVGRIDDVLCTPDRGFVGRLDTVFKSVPNSIVEAQIVQVAPKKIVLRIVPDWPRYRPQHVDEVIVEMRKRLGHLVEIRVEEVASLPRSANGKMRAVVNLCPELLPAWLHYDQAVS